MSRKRLGVAAMLTCAVLAACADSDPTDPGTIATPYQRQASAVFTGNIRIGVLPAATSVTIGSAGDYTVTGKTSGAVLMTGSNGTVTVTLGAPSVTYWRLQAMCASAATVAAKVALAQSLGYITNTEFVPAANCTRLLLGEFPLTTPFSVRNNFRLTAIANQVANPDAFWLQRTVSVTQYLLTRGATSLTTTQIPVLTSSTGIVTIGGQPVSGSPVTPLPYRGVAEVRVNSSGTLAGVNELPMEQYLYGVVPKELGPIAYPEVEAQKAQAIAARTYAMVGLGKRASDGYDLLATTSDQVYGGYSAEYAKSTAAVDATHGVVLTYNGQMIDALYSSASGGHTANSEEVYANAIPYLRGIPDAERGQALEHVPTLDVFKAHANPTSLRNVKESDFESDWSRFHRWSYEWTMQEISGIVSTFAGQDVGNVLEINVTERGPSGRALTIEYVTEAGTFIDHKDHIRTSLKFYNASHVLTSLPSTLFFIEPVYAHGRDKSLTGYVVYGGGFGHGVGMAQTGAEGMAEKGYTYDAILKHYYQGVELSTAY